MPLTPQDVSNKRFTPVRVRREGYDMAEVDAFLEEVEAELARLIGENEDLRGRLVAAGQEVPVEEPATDASDAVEAGTQAAPQPTAPEEPAPPPAPQPAAPKETLTVTTAAEASTAAARLLEIATRNADELVDEARQQAGSLLERARADAQRHESETRDRVERMEADARTRVQMLDAETDERRSQLFGDLDRERERLGGEVENLRAFEREYRARLKSYFEQQLAALDGSGESGLSGERLKSLLGDDGRDS
jgi:DivIVA domain-containing protein